MCNFYRRHIDHFADIAFELTELTKEAKSFKFQDRHIQAFIKLKQALCNAAILKSPEPGKDFIIRTDASDYAVGACLSQVQEGEEVPLAFASAKFTDVQKRWATIEKEAYGVIFALSKFDYLVFGSHIVIHSDHNPLKYVKDCASRSSKLTRWALTLARYSLEIRHIKGSNNVAADCLSRL